MARPLSNKPWTSDEERKLRKLWEHYQPKYIALKLGRSLVAVVEKAKSLGLKPNQWTRRRWSDEERTELRALWGRRDLLTIARRLGRTPVAVSMEAKKLGLGLPHHAFGKTLGELEKELGSKRSKILNAMKKLGFELRPVRTRTDPRFKRRTRLVVENHHIPQIVAMLEEHPRIYSDAVGAGRSTKGVWGVGKKPPCCKACGTTKRPHYAKDRCQRCYDRQRNKSYNRTPH